MNIFIVGGGTIGFIVAEYFSTEGHSVTVVEKNPDRIHLLQDRLDVTVVEGSATDIRTLKNASIATANLFLALTDNDEVNIVACTLAKHEGVPKKIARLNEQFHLYNENTAALKDLGVDEIVDPEDTLVEKLSQLVQYPGMAEMNYFFQRDYVVSVFSFERFSPYYGQPLSSIPLPEGVRAFGLSQISDFKPYDENVIVNEFLYVYYGCPTTQLERLHMTLNGKKEFIKNIMIFGGGYKSNTTSGYLAQRLMSQGVSNVTLVLPNETEAKQIANQYDVRVLIGDPSKPFFSRQEQLGSFDAFMGLSNNFEKDLFSSSMAYREGVPYTFALVRYPDHVNFMSTIPLTSFINPALVTANKIMKYHRADAIISRTVLNYEQVECIEFIITEQSPLKGRSIESLKFSSSEVIALTNGSQITELQSHTILQRGDHVLLLLANADREALGKVL